MGWRYNDIPHEIKDLASVFAVGRRLESGRYGRLGCTPLAVLARCAIIRHRAG
jgi:hypothetical protein